MRADVLLIAFFVGFATCGDARLECDFQFGLCGYRVHPGGHDSTWTHVKDGMQMTSTNLNFSIVSDDFVDFNSCVALLYKSSTPDALNVLNGDNVFVIHGGEWRIHTVNLKAGHRVV